RPGTADEVAGVMRLAHERAVPVTPVVAGYNVAGIAIPRQGGIVLDLTRLNRVLDVDHDAMYVLLEPGVTFGELKDHLDRDAPGPVGSPSSTTSTAPTRPCGRWPAPAPSTMWAS